MVLRRMNERLVRWRRREEISSEREEVVEGNGERVFERGKSGVHEVVGRVRKVVEELTFNVDWTGKRDIYEC